MNNKHIRLSSEQYIIDENNCITIPYSVLYNAGLGGVPEFNIMEKGDEEYVYSIIPSTDTKEGWEFVQKVSCTEEAGIKIDVTGMFELKPGDSVSVDVYEFELFLFDRVSVLKTKREQDEETGLDAGKIDWMKGFDELTKYMKSSDPYAPDENMRKKFADKCKRLHNPTDYNDLIENPPSFEEFTKSLRECGFDPYAPDDNTIEMLRDNLNKKFKSLKDKKGKDGNPLLGDEFPSLDELDAMFGKIIKEIKDNSNERLHRSKDPLLNEFIDDMLARVYGRDGQKIVMINSTELDQFVKDMTWWYKRIKKGNGN